MKGRLSFARNVIDQSPVSSDHVPPFCGVSAPLSTRR
jgi:hypothetical protein